jgi:catechol 2,3-dioxygenase
VGGSSPVAIFHTPDAARRAAIAAAAPKRAKSPFQRSFRSIARNRTNAGPRGNAGGRYRSLVESATTPRIAAATRMGAVHLTVSDLERSADFWTNAVGLRVLARARDRAELGVGGEPLVVLHEEPGARPAGRYTGLFHVALLVPARRDLAAWLAHAAQDGVQLQGASDHFVSEALYLGDPDGHGIEIYADRPREHWEGQTHRLTTLPLDVDGLLGELDDRENAGWERLPDGTRVGHTHLQVRDTAEAIGFYRDVLGFDLMATYGDQAAFLSAGGYHHHIGANTWNSLGAEPAPEGVARLLHAEIVVPDAEELDRVGARVGDAGEERAEALIVRDPSGIELHLRAA